MMKLTREKGEQLFLKYAGHKIIDAANSLEALERAADDTPLVDLHLPFLDGHGLIAEFFSTRQDARIIVISGCTDPRDNGELQTRRDFSLYHQTHHFPPPL